jgi:uncharacterized membrane protein
MPNPLHPAVVHFPIGLAFLVPLFAIGAIVMIRRGARASRAWSIPLIGAAALALSAWVAVETGEGQGERVEKVVGEPALESHEEMAELFLTGSVILVLISAAGLAPGAIGKSARILTAAGAVVLVAGVARVGHSGGQLVYQHGAASVYATGGTGASTAEQAGGEVTARDANAAKRDGDDDDR